MGETDTRPGVMWTVIKIRAICGITTNLQRSQEWCPRGNDVCPGPERGVDARRQRRG